MGGVRGWAGRGRWAGGLGSAWAGRSTPVLSRLFPGGHGELAEQDVMDIGGEQMAALFGGEDVAWFRGELAGARGAAGVLARRCGFDEHRAGEVVLAVAEAASNLDKHAVDGALLLRTVRTAVTAGVEFVAVDSRPGIARLGEALRDGTSTAETLGIGLGAIGRLADDHDIHIAPGIGTVLVARFWPRRGPRRTRGPGAGGRPGAAGLTRPITGEQVCGDAWAARPLPPEAGGGGTAALLMLSDGLGHGPLAAASTAAVRTFDTAPAVEPAGVLEAVHRELRGTRRAAVAVALVEPAHRRLRFCGIGSITARLLSVRGHATLPPRPGIVGHVIPEPRTVETPCPPPAACSSSTATVSATAGNPGTWTCRAWPTATR